MNALKVSVFVLALALAVSFTGQAWAYSPVAAPIAPDRTVVKPLVQLAQEGGEKKEKQEGKQGTKKRRARARGRRKAKGKRGRRPNRLHGQCRDQAHGRDCRDGLGRPRRLLGAASLFVTGFRIAPDYRLAAGSTSLLSLNVVAG